MIVLMLRNPERECELPLEPGYTMADVSLLINEAIEQDRPLRLLDHAGVLMEPIDVTEWVDIAALEQSSLEARRARGIDPYSS